MQFIPLFKVRDMHTAIRHYTEVLDFVMTCPEDTPESPVVDLGHKQMELQITTHESERLFGSVMNVLVADVDSLFAKYKSRAFLGALNQRPEILYAATGFDLNYPQYRMDVNVAKAKEAGVPVSVLLETMQGYYGGIYASSFNQFGKQYRVMVQAEPAYRNNLQSLNAIYVKNGAGTMAPVSEFITMTKVSGPQTISRFNLFTSISVIGRPKPGFSSGDAIKAVEEVAAQTLPAGYSIDYSVDDTF